MRMRKKANLLPRLERCAAVQEAEPEGLRGRWLEAYPGHKALAVELGCGKGRFTAGLAAAEPETLVLAVERVPDAMVVAMERVTAEGIKNVRFLDRDVRTLEESLAQGEADSIYINFCDPWPKSRDAKHRLTAPDFLRLYARLLGEGGRLWFKTDNAPLFQWSLEQFAAEGWVLAEVTDDLHAGGVSGILTDYEAKFVSQGIAIHRLRAQKTAYAKCEGTAGRLRNASLADAKGRAESLAAHRQKEEETRC